MTTDPAGNLIVFTVGPDRHVSAEVRAQAVDGFRQAWQRVSAEHGVRPEQVTGVAAYWEPSVLDRRYLEKTFGGVAVEHVFARPKPAGWAAALAEARDVFAQVPGEERTAPEQGELLLRSGSIGGSDLLRDTMPWVPIAGEDFFATFAYTALTPWDTVGMIHVLNNQLGDGFQRDDVVTAALATVKSGLMIEPAEDGRVIRMRRPDSFSAAGALLLPDFHEQLSAVHGWRALTVAIACPDVMWIAEAGSPESDELARSVRTGEQEVPEIRPTLLTVTAAAIELVAEGGGS